MRHNTFLALGAALFTGSTGASAQETLVTTRGGRGADASVTAGPSADSNQGGGYLAIKNATDPNFSRKIYLRFDLSGVVPPLTNLQSATLRLGFGPALATSPADKKWTFRVAGLNDKNAGESWDEKTITYNTAPANDKTGAGVQADATTPLGTFTATGAGMDGETVELSTPELVKFLQADTDRQVTLIITREEKDTKMGLDDVVHVFAPKEQSKRPIPTLALTFKAR